MLTRISGVDKRDMRFALAVSVVVHMGLLVFFVAAPVFTGKRPVEVVKIDLSFLGYGTDYPSPARGQGAVKAPIQSYGGRNPSPNPWEPAESVGKLRHGPATEGKSEPSLAPTTAPALGALRKAVAYDSPSTHTNASNSVGFLQAQSGTGGKAPTMGGGREASGGHGTSQGTGQDSKGGLVAGGRDHSYIRDAVMRNVRYPEEARRLGIEGRVILSFMVLENGTTGLIEVVSGSGFRFLDESAKTAVAITRIDRKVPYRVMVQLPITFRLQGKRGS